MTKIFLLLIAVMSVTANAGNGGVNTKITGSWYFRGNEYAHPYVNLIKVQGPDSINIQACPPGNISGAMDTCINSGTYSYRSRYGGFCRIDQTDRDCLVVYQVDAQDGNTLLRVYPYSGGSEEGMRLSEKAD